MSGTQERKIRSRPIWRLSGGTSIRHVRAGVDGTTTYFDYLRHTIAKLSSRQGFQKCSVDEDVLRLPERAEKILSVWCVNGSFSTDTGVDHCK